ncbi:MAG: transcriptional regulator [Burkholderiaceae bacterium]|nr:MAG: transcriptional regulator [Burkholderiaceae bacterium]TAM03575.1 MAG: transcriptional regulator [Pusillimonas sp.]
MTTQNTNPFVLPGFGQAGATAGNPLLASMEMMRQAWQGMSSSGALANSGMAAPASVEELDRRISEMRAVENWLRMSLSMLASTIQGLEVQRATIATLRAFVGAPATDGSANGEASPLEVVLGLKPSGQAKIKSAHETANESAPGTGAVPGLAEGDPAQAWWNMLQSQFNTLAAATMQGAEAVQAASRPLAEQAAAAVESASSAAAAAVKSPAAKGGAKAAKPARKAARKRSASPGTRSS